MSSLRDIKQRIVSIQKTQKITQAMKMVAASEFKRAQNKLLHFQTYQNTIEDIFADFISRLEPDEFPPILQPKTAQKQAVIIVAGDRGLCGGFNSHILKSAFTYINSQEKHTIDLYLIGNKAHQFFKSKPFDIAKIYTHIIKTMNKISISDILMPIITAFEADRYGKVTLFYNEFISALSTNQIQKQLLPIELNGWQENITKNKSDFFYEADKNSVIQGFMRELTISNVYKSILESHSAEEGARMAAMDSATENAFGVINDLTLLFNRTRQSAITTELSEIVAGAASLA